VFAFLLKHRSPRFSFLLLFVTFITTTLVALSSLQAQPVFEDALGRRITVAEPPKRIVSLAPNITEILYALNIGHRVVGVTVYSDYPDEAKQKPKVGSYVNLNIEKIVSLKPDLIIGTYGGNPKATVLHLEELGFPVYVTRTETVAEMLTMIEHIGSITYTSEKASVLVNTLRERINAVTRKVRNAKHPLVLLEINAKPLITTGSGSFQHEIIGLAGGKNLAGYSPARYPQYSLEDVVRKQPDVILISTMDRSGLFEQHKAEWMRWENIPAVQKGRIYFINSDLIDRASPRIVDGLEEMARLIHPALF
jgi:iron complex transport system substrate-binding protein